MFNNVAVLERITFIQIIPINTDMIVGNYGQNTSMEWHIIDFQLLLSYVGKMNYGLGLR